MPGGAEIVVGVELVIILALAWLARWALNQARYFGRLALLWRRDVERLRNPPRDSRGRFRRGL